VRAERSVEVCGEKQFEKERVPWYELGGLSKKKKKVFTLEMTKGLADPVEKGAQGNSRRMKKKAHSGALGINQSCSHLGKSGREKFIGRAQEHNKGQEKKKKRSCKTG